MKIATWNVNSLRVRLPHVLDWLKSAQEAVNANNVRIEQFPDVIIVNNFGFKTAELLEFSEAEKADVDMKALFT